tara:strand:+ start:2583 stop:2771 length:189 start_codon:yes stop_codon:yes gene_type:complete
MDDKETVEEFLARGGKIQEIPFGTVANEDARLTKNFTVRANVRAGQKLHAKTDKLNKLQKRR